MTENPYAQQPDPRGGETPADPGGAGATPAYGTPSGTPYGPGAPAEPYGTQPPYGTHAPYGPQGPHGAQCPHGAQAPYGQPPHGAPAPGQPYGQPYGAPGQYYEDPHAKSRLAAGLLGIFLGSLGIHRFYLGHTGVGVTMLLLTLVGSFVTFGLTALAVSVWGLVEGILYLTSKQGAYSVDATGRPLRA